MAQLACKQTGIAPSKQKSKTAQKLVTTLCVMSLGVLLTGCFKTVTTGSTAPNPKRTELTKKARCAGWKPLKYMAGSTEEPNDTDKTVKGIAIHNATGVNKGCWEK